MSMELHVFARRDLLPTRSRWQSALDDGGFSTVLGQTVDLENSSGFEPSTFEDRDTGFELFVDAAADIVRSDEGLTGRLDGRDVCVSFRWSGDLDELAAAVTAAATLAHVAGGLFFDPQEDLVAEGDAILTAAAEYMESL